MDSNGWTLLHAASHGGHLGVVKLLLLRGADVEVLNRANKSAVELASENNKSEVAKFIAEYKADANVRSNLRSTTLDMAQYGADEDWEDEESASLHPAAEEGNVDIVKSLLERGVDINGCDATNRTPLDKAACKGNIEIVRLLIERGAEVDSRDQWDNTPLHGASLNGDIEVARELIDHGANVNPREHIHWTPMHISAEYDHLEIVKLLLERGADVNAVNIQGKTPYQILVRRGHREMADLLRRHGASRDRFDKILLLP